MNLFLMSVDEIIRWYTPKTPEEKYLLEVMATVNWDEVLQYEKENSQLVLDNDRLADENQDLEDDNDNLIREVSRLEKQLERYKEDNNDLLLQIENLEDRLNE
jgi:cell division protein FtsB